jgi:hypothetical protein
MVTQFVPFFALVLPSLIVFFFPKLFVDTCEDPFCGQYFRIFHQPLLNISSPSNWTNVDANWTEAKQPSNFTFYSFDLPEALAVQRLYRVSVQTWNAANLSCSYSFFLRVDLTPPFLAAGEGIRHGPYPVGAFLPTRYFAPFSHPSTPAVLDLYCQRDSRTISISFPPFTDPESPIRSCNWGLTTNSSADLDALDVLPLSALPESGLKPTQGRITLQGNIPAEKVKAGMRIYAVVQVREMKGVKPDGAKTCELSLGLPSLINWTVGLLVSFCLPGSAPMMLLSVLWCGLMEFCSCATQSRTQISRTAVSRKQTFRVRNFFF